MKATVNWRRSVLVLAVAAAILGLWLVVVPGGGDSSRQEDIASSRVTVRPAVLVDTPSGTGEHRKVAAEANALAPNFEASGLDGDRFRLTDYRGRVVLLNFWATWCTACKAEMPAMQAVLDMHGKQTVAVLAVNMGDDPNSARRYLQDLGVDFDVAMDPDLTVSRAYRIVGLPVTYFINAEGVIRRVRFGEMTQEMVMAFTHEILGAAQATSPLDHAVEGGGSPSATREPAVLRVTPEFGGPGTILLQSPSLRCAVDFCAGQLLLDLRELPGVRSVNSRVVDEKTGDWGFFVQYDASKLNPDDIVAVYQRSLTESPDPLYPAPHRVEYLRINR